MRKCHFQSQKEEQGEKKNCTVTWNLHRQSALKIAANSHVLYFYYHLFFYLYSKQFI